MYTRSPLDLLHYCVTSGRNGFGVKGQEVLSARGAQWRSSKGAQTQAGTLPLEHALVQSPEQVMLGRL